MVRCLSGMPRRVACSLVALALALVTSSVAATAAASAACLPESATRVVNDCAAVKGLTLSREACRTDLPAPRLAKARMRRAVVLDRAARWELAAAAYRQVAREHPTTDDGPKATLRYLEIVNLLLTHQAPACVDELGATLPLLAERYCPAGAGCAAIRWMQDEGARAFAKQASAEAKVSKDSAKRWHAQAGKLLLLAWNHTGEQACIDGLPSCEGQDTVLGDAAQAFAEAGRRADALRVLRALVNPAYGLDGTEAGQRALYDIARHYEALTAFETARSWYARVAERYPKRLEAPDALERAALLALLGDAPDEGIEHVNLYLKLYGRTRPREAAKLAYTVDHILYDRGLVTAAEKHLLAAMPRIDKAGDLELRVRAHALLGRLRRELQREDAAKEYQRVLSDWRKHPPEANIRALRREDLTEAQNARRVGHVLTAVGEALFDEAEAARVAAEGVAPPAGTATDEAKETWRLAREQAVTAAEAKYLEVLRLSPFPPPTWTVAAAAEVAGMWARFHADAARAEAKKPSQAESEAVATLRARAKQASLRCAALGAKLQVADAFTKRCHAYLSQHYASEHPRMDELAPALQRGPAIPSPAPLPDPR